MRLKFTKMHGLGNDFVVFNAIADPISLHADQLRFIADRHFGIGCDQILFVEKPTRDDADFRYRIFNADGTEVAQCGNGARCFARFVRDEGLSDKDEIRVETANGIIVPRLNADGTVTVNMGAPKFEPAQIPFLAEGRATTYFLAVDSRLIEIGAVSMGNPHAVQVVERLDLAPVASEGPAIASHPSFPEGANAGFMEIVDAGHIKLRVFERGAGETLACGTGACAAVVSGIMRGLLGAHVQVETRGGFMRVDWEGGDTPVWMTGPAVRVFDGEIEL